MEEKYIKIKQNVLIEIANYLAAQKWHEVDAYMKNISEALQGAQQVQEGESKNAG